ncbi:MAG: hypothetical protein KC635_26920 [Myxococcales bacterium]|nr:hypothetical protein [Myxococcales bacterium]MCB9736507.1 transglutaminase [Deltaproteobacteria bacterium]
MSRSPSPSSSEPRRRSVVGLVLSVLFHVVLWAVVAAVPLFGVWLATSLAVYHDGPLWLAIVVGVLCFPVLPILWELWAARRRRKRKDGRERILNPGDRVLLRTFVLNLGFLVVMLLAFPRQGFAALSTRGDWMLGGSHSAVAESVRGALFDVAGGLEWLYDSASSNPYAKYADADADGEGGTTPAPAPGASGVSGTAPGVPLGGTAHTWPMDGAVHPVVRDMPEEARASVASVGKYIAERVTDPFERVKALHDFVATWLAYDVPATREGANMPSQEAADVFVARKAVCAGYARLMVALGKVTGDEIVYVVGHSRASGDDLDGVGHAWNAVEIGGAWYLMDATWDAGFVNGSAFTRRFATDYLMTPPAIFGIDHLPDDPRWQLRERPLSRGEFLRQPALSPRFFALGMTLEAPERSQVDTDGALAIELENPRGAWVMVSARPKDGGEPTTCVQPVQAGGTLECALPGDGVWQVDLFVNPEGRAGTYVSVGYLEANNG